MSWLQEILHPAEVPIRLIVVAASEADQIVLYGIASRAHWELRLLPDCEAALHAIRNRPANVILCHREALPSLSVCAARNPILVMTDSTDDQFWLDVMEAGGFDVITRPFHENRLVSAVKAAFQNAMK